MIEKRTFMFCQEDEVNDKKFFCHFAPSSQVSKLYNDKLPVFKVMVRELRKGEKSDYWAMWDLETNKFETCYHDRRALDMCFPYGIKGHEEYGHGKAYNVFIDVLEKNVKVN